MIKRVINFTNMDGVPVSVEYHFGLSKSEMIDIYANDPAFLEILQNVKDTMDPPQIVLAMQQLLRRTVGKRIDDRFVKSQDIIDEFTQTDAFDTILFDLLSNEKLAATFFEDVMPKDLDDVVAKVQANTPTQLPAAVETISPMLENVLDTPIKDLGTPEIAAAGDTPAWLQELRNPTRQELIRMDTDEIALAMRMKQAGQLK